MIEIIQSKMQCLVYPKMSLPDSNTHTGSYADENIPSIMSMILSNQPLEELPVPHVNGITINYEKVILRSATYLISSNERINGEVVDSVDYVKLIFWAKFLSLSTLS